jgi:N-acetylmuramic acid 6-phosphate (MurNAc-6-P) etherase
VTLKDTKKK